MKLEMEQLQKIVRGLNEDYDVTIGDYIKAVMLEMYTGTELMTYFRINEFADLVKDIVTAELDAQLADRFEWIELGKATIEGCEVAGIGSEMVDDGVSLDHAGRVVDHTMDDHELGA